MYCFVTTDSTCISLLLLTQHLFLFYYRLNMFCSVTTDATFIALLLLTEYVLICQVISLYLYFTIEARVDDSNTDYFCYYLLNMYCFVTTNSTCITLLLLTQHVLLCYYWLNISCFVTTDSTFIAFLPLTRHVLFCCY
jgi:hypothetical protein